MPARAHLNLTGDLFACSATVRPVEYRDHVCELVAKCLQDYTGDRYSASAEISRLLRKPVSKLMLDSYASPLRIAFNIPAYVVPALEKTCSTRCITEFMAEQGGGKAVFGPDVVDAEIGKIERLRDELNQRINKLKRARGSV